MPWSVRVLVGDDAVAFYTRKKVVTERWFGSEAKLGWV
jgi:hypothetical protein